MERDGEHGPGSCGESGREMGGGALTSPGSRALEKLSRKAGPGNPVSIEGSLGILTGTVTQNRICSHLAEKYAINLPLQQNQHVFFIKNVTEPIISVYVTVVYVVPLRTNNTLSLPQKSMCWFEMKPRG